MSERSIMKRKTECVSSL